MQAGQCCRHRSSRSPSTSSSTLRVRPMTSGDPSRSSKQRTQAWESDDVSVKFRSAGDSDIDAAMAISAAPDYSVRKGASARTVSNSHDRSHRPRSSASMASSPYSPKGSLPQGQSQKEGKDVLETLVRRIADADSSVRGGERGGGLSHACSMAVSERTDRSVHGRLTAGEDVSAHGGTYYSQHRHSRSHVPDLRSSKSGPLARLERGYAETLSSSYGSSPAGKLKLGSGGKGGQSGRRSAQGTGDSDREHNFLDTIFQATAEASVRGGRRYYNNASGVEPRRQSPTQQSDQS